MPVPPHYGRGILTAQSIDPIYNLFSEIICTQFVLEMLLVPI